VLSFSSVQYSTSASTSLFSINFNYTSFNSKVPSKDHSQWPLSTVRLPTSYSPPTHPLTLQNKDLPPVKPSAIALGTVFNHAISLAVLAPVFGETYQRAKAADSKEEFAKSRETATAAATWGSSLAGSALQTYGVGALINATGTLTYKGAAYLGTLILLASAAPSVS
jgi:uncharacterized protein DUF1761